MFCGIRHFPELEEYDKLSQKSFRWRMLKAIEIESTRNAITRVSGSEIQMTYVAEEQVKFLKSLMKVRRE